MKVGLGNLRERESSGQAPVETGILARGYIATLSDPPALLVLSRWLCGKVLRSLYSTVTKMKGSMPLILSLLSPHAGGVEHMECEIKLEGPASPDAEPGKEETEESKKRKRKPYRPGEALAWGARVVRGSSLGPQWLLILSPTSS